MSVALLHLSAGALFARQTQGYVFLVEHTMVSAIVVLPHAYGTVYRCSFENRLFHLIGLKPYRKLFCLGDQDRSAL
jgi:hypothetical protein